MDRNPTSKTPYELYQEKYGLTITNPQGQTITNENHTLKYNPERQQKLYQTIVTHSPPLKSPLPNEIQKKPLPVIVDSREKSPMKQKTSSRIIYDQRNHSPRQTPPSNIRIVKAEENHQQFMHSGQNQERGKVFVVNQPKIRYSSPSTSPPPVQNTVQNVSYLSSETVPKVQFERCVTECKNWQTKYNELYLKFMNLSAGGIDRHEEVRELRDENIKLKQKMIEFEARERKMRQIMESNFQELILKYQESTMEECTLLIDRFRLQSKNRHR